MKNRYRLHGFVVLFVLFALFNYVQAQTGGEDSKSPAKSASGSAVGVSTALLERWPGSTAKDFKPTPMPGIFEYTQGADIIYVTADGRYAFDGDLYDLEGERNVTDARRREQRLAILASIPEKDMLIYGPSKAKHTVTVFTDVDCTYCRKLHSEMKDYNARGIRVRYLLYPRMGPDSEGWEKAVSVACSPNRNAALDRAKRGEIIDKRKCASKVPRDFEIGQQMGLRGTPAIILPDGELLGGYLPPAMLAQRLDNLDR
ncbi:MAG: DsbC family protein [Steroidobacteraceae bacterium]|jgi:thiol:disulfide interchange protein DsbC|nr:DsbC family protein [Gammaproteobacteria bacterium]